jgi:O-methyltransferase
VGGEALPGPAWGISSPARLAVAIPCASYTAPVRAIESVYDLVPDIDDNPLRGRSRFPELTDETFWTEYERAKPFSMLHVTGFWNLYQAVHHVARSGVAGDVVECGCLFGGCSIFLRRLLDQCGLIDRHLHVFDTFDGFPEGSFDSKGGEIGIGPRFEDFRSVVEENVAANSRADGVTFHQGMVENTLPTAELGRLSLVRLDTDFYASTRVELTVLYPRLSPGGVLIIDDYGVYDGARGATDQYLATLASPPFLVRVDKGIVAGTKPG